MRWLAAIVLIYVASWLRQPPSLEWFAGESMVVAILALHAGYEECRTFRSRSVFAFICLAAWCDFIEYLLWLFTDVSQKLFAVALMLYLPWLTWIWMRGYRIRPDRMNPDRVCLLFLRPTDAWGTFLSFFGLSFSSVCVVAGGSVWAFRRKSGRYERSRYSAAWLNTHDIIDTGVETTQEILNELTKQLGVSRGFHCRCIYQIRSVLSIMGMKPKTILHYLPGMYAMQVTKEGEK